MKKFGAKNITALAVALALVTVGGVYATWSFSDSTATSGEKSFNIAVAGKVGSTSKGTYSVEKSSLIYRVDQYSYALTALASEYNTPTYDSSGATYAYVQTGVSKDSSVTPITTYANYARASSSTTYYAEIKAETTSGITSYTGTGVNGGWSTTQSSGQTTESTDYTAALCTIAGSYLRIIFTPSSDLQGDEKTYGVKTTFQFAWNSGSSSPQIKLNSSGVYDPDDGSDADIYNLDTTVYTIYPMGSGQTRDWSYDDTGKYFYYDITRLELVQYLSINKIIINDSTAYEALIAAADTSFKLVVNEDSGTALTTPTISTAVQDSNNTKLTMAANAQYANISNYICYIFNGNSPESATLVKTVTSGSVDSGTTDISITPTDLTDLSSGDYYVFVKAMSSDTSLYENSALTSGYVTINWNGTTVTCSSFTNNQNSL